MAMMERSCVLALCFCAIPIVRMIPLLPVPAQGFLGVLGPEGALRCKP